MTLTELKQRLTNSGFDLETEKEYGKAGVYTLYNLPAKQIENSVLKDNIIKIAVDEEGNAYFHETNPIFERDIKQYLQGKQDDGTIQGSWIQLMNSSEEIAEVKAWWEGTDQDGNTVIKTGKFFLSRDGSGNVKHQPM